MIRRYRKNANAVPSEPLRAHTVRLLYGDEELQAAVERARAFERRGSAEYQRRVGTYDRLLSDAQGQLTIVVGREPLRGIPARGSEAHDRSDEAEATRGSSIIEAEIQEIQGRAPSYRPSE
jgi:hypothetical protein